jgi:hypothetical protein
LKAQPCSSASVVPRPPSKRWIGGRDSEGNGMVMAILEACSVTGAGRWDLILGRGGGRS